MLQLNNLQHYTSAQNTHVSVCYPCLLPLFVNIIDKPENLMHVGRTAVGVGSGEWSGGHGIWVIRLSGWGCLLASRNSLKQCTIFVTEM